MDILVKIGRFQIKQNVLNLKSTLDGYACMTQMFDIFVIFTHHDFRESAEFNKNKDQKDIN